MASVPPLKLVESPGDGLQLPQNLEAEQALLGALMIDNRLVEDLPKACTAASMMRS